MDTAKLIGLGLLMLVCLTALPVGAQTADKFSSRTAIELLANGGCEMTLVSGEIPFWEEVTGSNWTQRQGNPSPWEGDHYFFAGAGATAELRQDVDLADYAGLVDAGNQIFSFAGYVRSWDQSPADVSQIILQYLNFDKTQVLAAYDLGQHANITSWLPLDHSAVAPGGSRYIRVRLISIRNSGTNNDGYFDGLSLSTVIPEPLAPADVSILIQGNDVSLAWSPVTMDSSGNPVTISLYRIYAGDDPYFICSPANLAGTSSTPDILLIGEASGIRKFYKVIAVE